MRLNILLFAAGVWLLQQQAELPDTRTILLLGSLGFAFVLPMPPGRAARIGQRILVAGARLADELPAEWEGRDIRVEGVVAGLPQPSERSLRFEFDVERVLDAG